MTVKLSLQQAIDLAEMAVKEKGADYVYRRPFSPTGFGTNCAYYDQQGEPSCLVGQILFRVGVLIDPKHRDNFCSVRELVGYLIEVDYVTKLFLATLQSQQDHGTPWGRALKLAKAATSATLKSKPVKAEFMPVNQMTFTIDQPIYKEEMIHA